MLRRRHGVGTFVGAREQISGGLETLISITQWIENHGYRAGTQGTELMRRSLSATEQEVFQHWNISTVGEIHRVRTADGKPVLFSIDIIPDKFAPALADELDNSLLEYLEKQWGQVVIMARTTIDVTIATSEIATKLGLGRGAPLLHLRQVHYNEAMEALLLSYDYFVPEHFHFDMIRRRS